MPKLQLFTKLTQIDLNATKVSLEVLLGVVSTVTPLQLEPTFKRNVTFQVVNTGVGRDGGQNEYWRLPNPLLLVMSLGSLAFLTPSYLPQALMSESQRMHTGYGVSRFCGFQARPATGFEFGKPPVTHLLISDC